MNRAGLLTEGETDYVDININSGLSLAIKVNTLPASSSADVILNITTNRISNCFYTDQADKSPDEPFIIVHDDLEHIEPLPTLTSGVYDYYFKCIAITIVGEETASLHLTIDTTPPTMLFVNDTGPIADNPRVTYYTDRLEANWLAYDNETGIEMYEYTIYMYKSGGNVLIYNDTTAEENVLVDDLTLNNSRKYFFSVRAMNPARLWSGSKTGSGVTVDNTSKPATCNDGVKNDDETAVDCGGSCPKCGEDKSCDINRDCLTGYCNIYSICAFPNCNDTVKNGNETGIDCGGGACPACGADKDCEANSDCISGNCTESECTKPDTCKNNKIGEDETDFDCGGSICPKCGVSKQCNTNYDCIDDFCKGGICVKPSCEDEEINQGETDIDCGGPCSGCEIGFSCELDSGCKSGNCKNNLCVEPLDSDGDGLPNEWEKRYNLYHDNVDTDENGILDPDEDMDLDGLTNLEEWQSGYVIDPRNPDTDGDGYSDLEEIEAGTDPTDPESHPGSNYFLILLFVVIIGLLGAGGYYGYNLLMEKKGFAFPQREVPPKPVTPSRAPHGRIPPSKPVYPTRAPPGRVVPPKPSIPKATKSELRRKKVKKREKLFEAFGAGPVVKKEEKIKHVEETKKPVTEPVERAKPETKQGVFKKLSDTFGKEVKEDTFNKLNSLIKSEKVERKDIFDTIKHLSRKGTKEFTKTASKHMLTHLINEKKTNKAHVTDVLHSLKDEKVLSEDDVFDILGHIDKHEKKKRLKKIEGS